MIWERAALLANGREIVLEVVPVDPRTLFRGDYVSSATTFAHERPAGAHARSRRGHPRDVAERAPTARGRWPASSASALRHRPRRGRAQGPRRNTPRLGRSRRRRRRACVTASRASSCPKAPGRDLKSSCGEKKLSALIAVDSGWQRRHQGADRRRQAGLRGAATSKSGSVTRMPWPAILVGCV